MIRILGGISHLAGCTWQCPKDVEHWPFPTLRSTGLKKGLVTIGLQFFLTRKLLLVLTFFSLLLTPTNERKFPYLLLQTFLFPLSPSPHHLPSALLLLPLRLKPIILEAFRLRREPYLTNIERQFLQLN